MRNENIAIKIEDLTIAYKQKPVLWDIDLDVPENKVMGILGPNGAGKSTLLKAIMGLIKPIAGDVKIFGRPAKEQKGVIGYIPQRLSVDWDFPTTVLDVVMMGTYGSLGLFKRPSKTEKQVSMAMLEKVEMHEYCDRQISELSGGQQQRVFLARSLVQKADIYLMDEPFQGVDATTEKLIVNILKEMQKNGKTLLVVHHDLPTVSEYFDWVTMINVRMIVSGPVEDVFNEKNLKHAYGGRISYLQKIHQK